MISPQLKDFADGAIGRYVGISHFTMARLFARELQKAGIELTTEQCRVLFVLFMEDGATQHMIGQLLWQEKSSLSRLINTLENKGYVYKISSRSDERQKHVHLTEKGWAMQDVCLQCAADMQKRIEDKFSPEEWEQTIFLLQKLAEASRQELASN